MDLTSVIESVLFFCGGTMVLVIGGSYIAYKLKKKHPSDEIN